MRWFYGTAWGIYSHIRIFLYCLWWHKSNFQHTWASFFFSRQAFLVSRRKQVFPFTAENKRYYTKITGIYIICSNLNNLARFWMSLLFGLINLGLYSHIIPQTLYLYRHNRNFKEALVFLDRYFCYLAGNLFFQLQPRKIPPDEIYWYLHNFTNCGIWINFE